MQVSILCFPQFGVALQPEIVHLDAFAFLASLLETQRGACLKTQRGDGLLQFTVL